MLRELTIHDLVIIEKLNLELAGGLNVFSGETGAGKSIIVEALGLLTGERGRADLLRTGEGKATVEGIFDWPENEEFALLAAEAGLDPDDGLLVISREITASGKSIARINGRAYPLSVLKKMSGFLLDIHEQDDNGVLAGPGQQTRLLDSFDPQLAEMSARLKSACARVERLSAELDELRRRCLEYQKEQDFIEFQIAEIEKASLTAGEEETLEERRNLIRSATRLQEACRQALALVYAGEGTTAYDLAARASEALSIGSEYAVLSELRRNLEGLCAELEEVGRGLERFLAGLDFEPGELEAVEERLYLIGRLTRKYGGTTADVLRYLEELHRRKKENEGFSLEERGLEQEVEQAISAYEELAGRVSALRAQVKDRLEHLILQEIRGLAMPDARFAIELRPLPGITAQGREEALFMFCANPGEEMRPLARAASGGEMGRTMLALKAVFAGISPVQTFVFDEIDVGLSGFALEQVAERLVRLAGQRQVIMVTHSAQAAAFADAHYVITKDTSSGRTSTSVRRLGGDEVLEELARMMAGDMVRQSALSHARELLAAAAFAKKNLRCG